MSGPIYSNAANGGGTGGFISADNFNNNSITSATFEELFKYLSPSAAPSAINQQRSELTFPSVDSRSNATAGLQHKSAIPANSRGDHAVSALARTLMERAFEEKKHDDALRKRIDTLSEEFSRMSAKLNSALTMVRQQREAPRNPPKPMQNNLPGGRPRVYNTPSGPGMNPHIPDPFAGLDSYKL